MEADESEPDEQLSVETGDGLENYSVYMNSLVRVRVKDDKMPFYDVMAEAKRNVESKTAEIYLQKELEAACQQPSSAPSSDELDDNINLLQQCISDTTAVQYAMHNTVVNAQLHDDLQEQLSAATSEVGPELGSVLQQSRFNLNLNTSLCRQLAALDQKYLQLVEKRRRLAALHKEVEKLWCEKHDHDHARDKPEDSEEIKEMRAKLRDRTGRLQLLTHFVQTLVTAMSSRWGTDPHLIKVLRACDLYCSSHHGTIFPFETICELLEQ